MTILVLKDFHELRPPMVDGGFDTEWCTFDSDDVGMYYLLNKDRYKLCNLALLEDDEIAENLHFLTEVTCHEAAYNYYFYHSKPYPYMQEWKNAIAAEGGTQPPTNIQSEPMDFT